MAKGSVAYYAGVVTCGKVHLCPVCAAKIRSARANELQVAGTAWESAGHGLAMLTLTMRHYDRQPLRGLVRMQRDAWRLAFGQNAGRGWRAAKREFGVVGYVRAWEVTHGTNGWHPHYHVLLFLDRPLTAAQGEQLQRLAFRLWSAALVAVGAYMPAEFDRDGQPVGVRLDVAGRGDAGVLSRYLMKFQDGKAGWTLGDELTRQDVKTGRAGHRTPFEVLRSVRETGDAADADLWRDFEVGAHSVRALYWSQGIRKQLAELAELDERTDAEIAAEQRDGEPLAVIPSEAWYGHVVRYDGRALALLRAAEALGAVGVRTLIESWGLIWGRDVLPAPDSPDAGARVVGGERFSPARSPQ